MPRNPYKNLIRSMEICYNGAHQCDQCVSDARSLPPCSVGHRDSHYYSVEGKINSVEARR